MTHAKAVQLAIAVEEKLDDREPCTDLELAAYTLWRGYTAMEWASKHPVQAFLMRLKGGG